jgi:hypothetical protein
VIIIVIVLLVFIGKAIERNNGQLRTTVLIIIIFIILMVNSRLRRKASNIMMITRNEISDEVHFLRTRSLTSFIDSFSFSLSFLRNKLLSFNRKKIEKIIRSKSLAYPETTILLFYTRNPLEEKQSTSSERKSYIRKRRVYFAQSICKDQRFSAILSYKTTM